MVLGNAPAAGLVRFRARGNTPASGGVAQESEGVRGPCDTVPARAAAEGVSGACRTGPSAWGHGTAGGRWARRCLAQDMFLRLGS